MATRRYDGVVFDLLTALLDSWVLWHRAAGSQDQGEAWRREYLRITYGCGAYRPYRDLLVEAAHATGTPEAAADRLEALYPAHVPWPGVQATLTAMRQRGLRLAVATNCSVELGAIAAATVGVPFDAVVTAEEAGFYKPHPAPYRLAAERLGVAPERLLFVAGSAMDVPGAAGAGMDVFWHNRRGLPLAEPAHVPRAAAATIEPVLDLL